MRPLEGITVVAVEQAVAGPFASRQLADLGARVIKIERPATGDFARAYDTTVNGLASYFVWLNRSKESLTLDLKSEHAPAVLQRLFERADVFLQNLAPGAVERLGLRTEDLRRTYPRLIVCNISGYGSSGPYRDRKAYDLLIQSETGLLSITGTEDVPSKVGISVADIAAGMYAYSGILTALLVRQRTNEGTTVDVSLLDALGEWMGSPAYYTKYGGSPPPRTGPHHASIAPYGPFETSDQSVVYLGVQNEREWQTFCAIVLQRSDLAADPRFRSNTNRVTHRLELDDTVAEICRQISASEMTCRLEQAQIAHARMNTVQEFVEHPQLMARSRWRTVGSSVGPLQALVPPVDLGGVEPIMGPVPGLGEHTDRVLAELGFAESVIGSWHQAGVV